MHITFTPFQSILCAIHLRCHLTHFVFCSGGLFYFFHTSSTSICPQVRSNWPRYRPWRRFVTEMCCYFQLHEEISWKLSLEPVFLYTQIRLLILGNPPSAHIKHFRLRSWYPLNTRTLILVHSDTPVAISDFLCCLNVTDIRVWFKFSLCTFSPAITKSSMPFKNKAPRNTTVSVCVFTFLVK